MTLQLLPGLPERLIKRKEELMMMMMVVMVVVVVVVVTVTSVEPAWVWCVSA